MRKPGWLDIAQALPRAASLIWLTILLPAEARSEAAAGRPTATENEPSAAPTAAEGKRRANPAPQQQSTSRFDINEFRVEGADAMPQIEVEEAIYPFMGPGRSADDVEKARAALEKAYASKGYQTVSVSIPRQNVQNGIVVLKVAEVKVGRLRVKNSRYFDLQEIKNKAPSLAEGKLPNFNAVTKDIVALNQWQDRKVTPALRAGVTPGTVDVDLNVEDKLPLHASVEVNNRQSPNTTALRVNSSVHYDNLWQRGDSVNFSFQIAPLRSKDAEVLSGSYLARTPVDWLNMLVYAVDSKSNVATVGSQNVVGPGQIVGTRAVITLPPLENFFHTVSIGADYKHFGETVTQSDTGASFSSPVTYFPVTASYSATWQREGAVTQLNAGLTGGTRGLGSTPTEFDAKRTFATESFFYLRADASHTQDLPGKFQIFAKVQGQVADQPLVSSEEFSVGGLDTVRGYLESETLGDSAMVATAELRTPNLGEWIAAPPTDAPKPPQQPVPISEWRLFAFGDVGRAFVLQPLAEQTSVFNLASYGIGTRFRLYNYANGMVVLAMPVVGETFTSANHPRVLFRVWGEL